MEQHGVTDMTNTSLVIGSLLAVLGVVGYLGTGMQSFTALIPTLFGLLFILLGAVGRRERMRRHAMHAAAALSLIGLVATARGLVNMYPMLRGEVLERPAAVIAQAIMAVLCAVFLALAVRSFIAARRAPKAP
jgi:uncharacterized membrane protein